MKIRDLSLMATGAIISIAVIACAFTLGNPPKALAQAAAAVPGATAMAITTYTPVYNGTEYFIGGGVITINDPNTRKVTVVAYQSSVTNGAAPFIKLSPTNTFTY